MFDSIRVRLTFWYVGVLALILAAFAGVTYFLVVNTLARQTDDTLAEMGRSFETAVASELTDKSDKLAIEQEITEDVNESQARDFTLVVTDAADWRLISSTTNDEDFRVDLTGTNPTAALESKRFGDKKFRIYKAAVEFNGFKYNLRIARDLEDQEEFLARLREVFLLAVPFSLIVAGLGGYFLARKSLAPVARMSSQAARIGATNLNERLPVGNEKDELGNLATTLNELLTRLEDSFEQQQQFMADASHELRTPLAIVRGESEVALSKDDRTSAELRESLEIVHDESIHLSKIVEELMTLARADAGQLAVGDKTVELDELLKDCVRVVQVLAKKRNISLEINIGGEMQTRGDAPLLRRMFINLLDNAIKYNRDDGKVSADVEITGRTCRILISDTGPGISDSELPKVFDRFYRADKARRRRPENRAGGAGLGLPIALRIAQLHGGTIAILSSDESGTVFAVDLPTFIVPTH